MSQKYENTLTIADYSDTNYLYQVLVFLAKNWDSWYNTKDLQLKIKGTVMQIEKALINDLLRVSKVS